MCSQGVPNARHVTCLIRRIGKLWLAPFTNHAQYSKILVGWVISLLQIFAFKCWIESPCVILDFCLMELGFLVAYIICIWRCSWTNYYSYFVTAVGIRCSQYTHTRLVFAITYIFIHIVFSRVRIILRVFFIITLASSILSFQLFLPLYPLSLSFFLRISCLLPLF